MNLRDKLNDILIYDWKAVLKRGWSARVALFGLVLAVAEQLLPVVADFVPRGTYAMLYAAVIVSRVLYQKNVP